MADRLNGRTAMLSGSERIHNGGAPITTLSEFWQWAYSNLWDDVIRGAFAEFVVARRLGLQPLVSSIFEPWVSYDLKTADGLMVEVKSSCSQQAWKTKRPTSIQFPVKKTQPMNKGYS
ncbi:MAG: hypothetical protein WBD55_01230, partial [Dehalococcoidia bacterium]